MQEGREVDIFMLRQIFTHVGECGDKNCGICKTNAKAMRHICKRLDIKYKEVIPVWFRGR